jgi:hypothetical protein
MKKIFLILALLASNGAFATGYADAAKCASKTVFKVMSQAGSDIFSKKGAIVTAGVVTAGVAVFGSTYFYLRYIRGNDHNNTMNIMANIEI